MRTNQLIYCNIPTFFQGTHRIGTKRLSNLNSAEVFAPYNSFFYLFAYLFIGRVSVTLPHAKLHSSAHKRRLY